MHDHEVVAKADAASRLKLARVGMNQCGKNGKKIQRKKNDKKGLLSTELILSATS